MGGEGRQPLPVCSCSASGRERVLRDLRTKRRAAESPGFRHIRIAGRRRLGGVVSIAGSVSRGRSAAPVVDQRKRAAQPGSWITGTGSGRKPVEDRKSTR